MSFLLYPILGSTLLIIFSEIIEVPIVIPPGVSGRLPRRIVSGNLAERGEFPYIISLKFDFKNDDHICGGSIISPKHILTAGHCVDWLYPRDLIVVSGTTRQDDENAVHSQVANITRHPGFVRRTKTSRIQNDLAVLTLKEPLHLDGHLQDAVKLPVESWTPGTAATVAGWGYEYDVFSPKYSKDVPNDLRKLQVTIISHEECAKKRAQPFEYQICATRSDATVCQGDSGGPLVVNNVIVGVVSTTSCRLGSYSGYMDTYYFREFIQDAMKE
ncbi:trypsin alpha-like [Fopius arisanus]|uniref:Trypsin alpha-like n=1 Tax=Fopius arisanus TaxID=64838 RepID=A0A9R1U0J4_9HYME|nr:PREDICTED: trypsin alpha-like [Fopius arisanus]